MAESSRLNRNEENLNDDIKGKKDSGKKAETKTPVWTRRKLEKILKYHTQIGFAADHFEMIDQIKSVQAILSRALHDESSKVGPDENVIGICRLSSSILRNTEFLRVLILDTPLIATMKKAMDNARQTKILNGNQVTRKPDPSEAVVPDGYFTGGKIIDEDDVIQL
ncbi:MAG: hypothetical protein ACR2IS_14445 [Nitrososphaeraceae archaeon]